MMETKHERGFREQVGIMVGIFRISDHDADQVFIQVKTSQVIYILTVNNSREASIEGAACSLERLCTCSTYKPEGETHTQSTYDGTRSGTRIIGVIKFKSRHTPRGASHLHVATCPGIAASPEHCLLPSHMIWDGIIQIWFAIATQKRAKLGPPNPAHSPCCSPLFLRSPSGSPRTS